MTWPGVNPGLFISQAMLESAFETVAGVCFGPTVECENLFFIRDMQQTSLQRGCGHDPLWPNVSAVTIAGDRHGHQ